MHRQWSGWAGYVWAGSQGYLIFVFISHVYIVLLRLGYEYLIITLDEGSAFMVFYDFIGIC